MWSLGKGAESEVIDMGQGQYFVVRLDDVMPAALPRSPGFVNRSPGNGCCARMPDF